MLIAFFARTNTPDHRLRCFQFRVGPDFPRFTEGGDDEPLRLVLARLANEQQCTLEPWDDWAWLWLAQPTPFGTWLQPLDTLPA